MTTLVYPDKAGGVNPQCARERIRASRAAYAARYPLADPALPLMDRIAADEATLRAVIQERSKRQFLAR